MACLVVQEAIVQPDEFAGLQRKTLDGRHPFFGAQACQRDEGAQLGKPRILNGCQAAAVTEIGRQPLLKCRYLAQGRHRAEAREFM